MHPMLTLPVKETALKLIIKVLGSRVYKIENSFLKEVFNVNPALHYSQSLFGLKVYHKIYYSEKDVH